jgi:hypothetical protein
MSKVWLMVCACLFLRVAGSADNASEGASASSPTPWSVHEDSTFHYRYSYPDLGYSGGDAVVIDKESDPVFICDAPNQAGWSSRDFFDHWRHLTPPGRVPDNWAEEHCADYPSYAQWSASTVTVAGRTAEEIRIQRGPYQILCTYVAAPKVLWAACSPPDKIGSAALQKHQEIYHKIVGSLEFHDEKKTSDGRPAF